MKGITHALVLIFLVLLLNSCFSPYSGKEEMATITISLGDGAARAPVWPDLTNSSSPHFSKIRHMVILTDSTGFPREIPMGPGVLSTTRTVPPGTYTATIVGYYRDILFARDMTTYGTSNPQTVTAGTPTPLTFSMQKVAAIYIVNNEDDWNDLQDNYPDGWMAIDYMDDGVRDFILEITSSFEIEGGDLFLGASDITATIFGNGFTLSKDPTPGTGYIFEIETPDQTVIIQDLNLEGIPGNNNALISVGNHATLIMMENSSIFGNENGGNATPGGGVYVGADGTFIMEGGTIGHDIPGLANQADEGGGVYVDGGGTFIMNGGSVTGNQAYLQGGGFYIESGGTLTMKNDATIDSNTAGVAAGYAGHRGGGVFIQGTFPIPPPSPPNSGPGLLTMEGGDIKCNVAHGQGGGVYVNQLAEFHKTGGVIHGVTPGPTLGPESNYVINISGTLDTNPFAAHALSTFNGSYDEDITGPHHYN